MLDTLPVKSLYLSFQFEDSFWYGDIRCLFEALQNASHTKSVLLCGYTKCEISGNPQARLYQTLKKNCETCEQARAVFGDVIEIIFAHS